MNDIHDTEHRIHAALERIRSGLETTLAQPVADPEELASLREALDHERRSNSELEERLRDLRERQETQIAGLERDLEALGARAEAIAAELARLRAVNAQLRENNAALRAANAEGLGDSDLINTALQSELEALRSLREGDRAELDAVLTALAPLVTKEGAYA